MEFFYFHLLFDFVEDSAFQFSFVARSHIRELLFLINTLIQQIFAYQKSMEFLNYRPGYFCYLIFILLT